MILRVASATGVCRFCLSYLQARVVNDDRPLTLGDVKGLPLKTYSLTHAIQSRHVSCPPESGRVMNRAVSC